MLRRFLSEHDTSRAEEVLRKVLGHDIEAWALAGGLAFELRLASLQEIQSPRPLNDIDLVVASFGSIPATLANDFLFAHVHPHAEPGKTLVQAIDPQHALRVDIFGATPGTMARASNFVIAGNDIKVVALEDLIARTTRLVLNLSQGRQVPAKHARDFARVEPLTSDLDIEPAWQDHREANQPARFADAHRIARELLSVNEQLLTEPVYSTDPTQTCPRCEPTDSFPLADPTRVLSILGYC